MLSKLVKTNDKYSHEKQLLWGGISGLASVAIIQMIGQPKLDTALSVSLFAFAISIPFLVFCILAEILRRRFLYTSVTNPWYLNSCNFLGISTGVIGLAGLFWHLSWQASIVFLFSGLLVICFAGMFYNFQSSINKG
jgi:hypothetical protein